MKNKSKNKLSCRPAAFLALCSSILLTGCGRISDSFRTNLIVEDRYRMILDGLQVTLLITLCAVVLGTLLGGLVCWMRMNRRPWLQQTAKVYIELMRGTPVLVLLMLMYYVLMAPLDATGIVVAIVTFAMNTAAYVGEMLRTTIQGIDRGQTEAGLALGFTQRQTFFRIILPQVVRAVMPIYQGEVVSLLKGTSIVGYIAVSDMTRASDLIRSRTFDAFFPLIVTAIMYFLIAWLIGLLLTALTQRQRAKAVAAAVALALAGAAGYMPSLLAADAAETTATAEVPPAIKALSGKRVSVILGSIQDIAVTDMAPDADVLRVATTTDMMAALESGRVDVGGSESLTLIFNKELMAKVDSVGAGLTSIPIGACFKKDNTELQQDFNNFLEEIRKDGTLARILERWNNADDPSALAIPQQRGTGRTLRIATYPAMPPFNFINSGKPSGLEIEIMTEWTNRRNWRLEFLVMDFAAQIPAVQTGKADMAMGAISVTEERQKQVLFSDGYIESHIVFITRKGEAKTLFSDCLTPGRPTPDLSHKGGDSLRSAGDLHRDSSPLSQGVGHRVLILLAIVAAGGAVWLLLRRRKRNFTPSSGARLDEETHEELPIISISHMKKSFGTFDVLRDINLDVHRGEVISVIGPSGTGKSTFLRCLNLLEQPTSGSILINGEDILASNADVPLLRRQMGMVFQSFNLFNGMSVIDNICLAPMQLLGKSREEARQRAYELLQTVGLAERADAMPQQLSGGQKQRVAIARALAMEPKILLFDEPTSALDPTMVSEVLGVMTRLAREGMTMIVVTHEMRFARQVSSRVLFFADGVVYEDGPSSQLFEHPQRERTRQFIRQIHQTSFLIESEQFDWFAMTAQMEHFCQKYNLSRRQTDAALHVTEESLALLGTAPGTRLTLAYSEQDNTLQLTVECPHAVNPDAFRDDSDDIAATILHNFSRDISIDGNTLCISIQ